MTEIKLDGETYYVPSYQADGLKLTGAFTDGNGIQAGNMMLQTGTDIGSTKSDNGMLRTVSSEAMNPQQLLSETTKQVAVQETTREKGNKDQEWDSNTSFGQNIEKILPRHKMTLAEFKKSIWGDQTKVNDTQKKAVREVRETVPMPDAYTWLQKSIPYKEINNYLSGRYNQVRGFLARKVDIEQAKTYDNMYQSLGLNYTKANNEVDFDPTADESMGVIRFRAKQGENLIVPYGELVEGLDRTFTGNGFVRSMNGEIVPEFKLTEYSDFLEGELYEVRKDGTWILRGVYDSDMKQFIEVSSKEK